MKITTNQLRRIIREEVSKVKTEAFHSPTPEEQAMPGRDALSHAAELYFDAKDSLDAAERALQESLADEELVGPVAQLSKKLLRAVGAVNKVYAAQDAAVGDVYEFLDK
jgi:hypothetical protein